VLAAVGLWYDDYIPGPNASPVTPQLLNVLTYSTGVEKNDKAFSSTFPYLAMPHSGTGACSGNQIIKQPEVTIFDPGFSKDFLVAARMNGGNEVPAVVTDAIGVATITFNDTYTQATVNMSVTNLSSPFQGVHIHTGKAGVNGPVKFDLTDAYKGGRLTKTFAVTRADVASLINGDLYINVHTTNHPGGELRGQLGLEAGESFGAELTGAKEIPAVNGEGRGIASIIYTANTSILEINLLATKLSGPIKGIHIHKGDAGVSGPVVEDLTAKLVENTIMVKITAGSYIADLRAGNLYINIHTEANPNGEIRGQITKINGLHFDAWMTDSQEVPRVDNNTIGLAMGFVSPTLDNLSYRMLIDNPSTSLSAAHIHKSKLGTSGSVVVDLHDDLIGQYASNDAIAVNKQLLDDYLAGNLYFNVHSSTYPAGEVRGQIYRVARDGYAYDLCQKQETTPVNNAGDASGSGMFAFNRDYDEAHMMVVASKLGSAFQGAHIHNGKLGEAGPVVFDLTDKWAKGGAFFYYVDGVTPTLAGLIQKNNAYVNVHTTNNPNGEIRGQITKTPECPFQSAIVEVGNKSFQIDVFPNPVANVVKVKFSGDNNLYENSTLQVRDLTGRLMLNTKVNTEIMSVDMSGFTSGIYFIQASNKTYKKSIKIVKI
jgi:Cu/Zn superoxide dismutase